MKIHSNYRSNLFVDVAMIAAKVAGQEVEEVFHQTPESIAEFKKTVAFGKFPALETADGYLSESTAIAKHFGRLNPGSGLNGSNDWEHSQVDQWVAWTSSAIGPHLMGIYMNVFAAYGPADMDKYNHACKEIKDLMKPLNSHLNGKQFLVGDKITVADIALAVFLSIPFQVLFEGGYRKAIPHVSAWAENILKHPAVTARLGRVHFASKVIKPVAPPKAKEEKKAPAPAAKKEEKKEEKKPENPLDALPESKFVLPDFKTYFVNLADKRGEGMKHFFDNYDPEGYCIYHIQYDKYEGEGEVLYQTANLMNGFLQRADHVRKYTFASLAILGDEPKLEIEGVWMFRGKEIPQIMLDHPQFEYYKQRKLDVNNDADKKLMTDFWCGADGDEANGMKIQEIRGHR